MATQDPEDIRRSARDILDGPEFTKAEDSIWVDIARAVLDPVGTINKVIEWLFRESDERTGNALVAWLTVAIAVALIAFLVVRLTRSVVRDDSATVRFAPESGSKSWRDLNAEAEELEAAGEWRAALRLRYASLVARLAEQGVVERRPGRTTGEYLRQVQTNAPNSAPSFGEATAIFELVWYGDGEADKDEVDRFVRLSEASIDTVYA